MGAATGSIGALCSAYFMRTSMILAERWGTWSNAANDASAAGYLLTSRAQSLQRYVVESNIVAGPHSRVTHQPVSDGQVLGIRTE